MKLWSTTTENKCFVKTLWHLLSEYVKTTVLLVCSSDTVDVQRKNTVHTFAILYIRKKSTNRWLEKKKKSTYWTNQKNCYFYTFT